MHQVIRLTALKGPSEKSCLDQWDQYRWVAEKSAIHRLWSCITHYPGRDFKIYTANSAEVRIISGAQTSSFSMVH